MGPDATATAAVDVAAKMQGTLDYLTSVLRHGKEEVSQAVQVGEPQVTQTPPYGPPCCRCQAEGSLATLAEGLPAALSKKPPPTALWPAQGAQDKVCPALR